MMESLPPSLDIAPLEFPPNATVTLPGSKSITNRALICAALASGETTLTGALFADDTEAMVEAVRSLGAEVSCVPGEATMRIRGTAGTVATPAGAVVDARMSGTTGRFVAPVLALSSQAGDPGRPSAVEGPALRRPGRLVAEARRACGVPVRWRRAADGDLRTNPLRRSRCGHRIVPASSSLGLMLAGPLVPGGLILRIDRSAVSRSYVEMTAAVMRAFGAAVAVEPEAVHVAGNGYTPVGRLRGENRMLRRRPISGLRPRVTAGTVGVEGLGADSIQGDTRFVALLRQMGASTEEVSGCTTVTGGPLQGVDVDLSDMSDTAPTLAVVASLASTPTTVRGIGFVRGKESDRIAAVVSELRRCGVDATELADGFAVVPGPAPAGARVRTYDDHRIAMAFSVLGLVVPGMQIEDPGCVAKTFPGFYDALEALRDPVPGVRR